MATDDAPRRIAQLPGFDTAPDVYETPDLDDSATTTSTTHASASDTDETSEDEEDDGGEDDSYGVSRRRLFPERARSRFGAQARAVDAKGTDLSERVDGKRKGLRLRVGVEREEEEGLEERIARLRREVEECRVLAAREKSAAAKGDDDDNDDDEEEDEENDDVEGLSKLLASIDIPKDKARNSRKSKRRPTSKDDIQIFHDALPERNADADTDEHTLSRIAAFDTRLASLETALGLSSVLADPSTSADLLATPLLPTLTLLDQQLATLTSATSLANLEAASSRIAKLKQEAEQLSSLQQQRGASTTDEEEEEDVDEDAEDGKSASPAKATLTPEDAKRLEGLFTILPTMQSLSPIVPALITRLRSLRTLHQTAATAAGDLDAIEQRQDELDRELKMWREGLDKVEKAVKDADTANGRNGNFVKTWVDDLEGRVQALGR